MAANDETYNLGVETLKKSQTLCPFTVGTYQYDATDVAPTNYLCWFKSENFLAQSKNGKLDPAYTECDVVGDFKLCPIYLGLPGL